MSGKGGSGSRSGKSAGAVGVVTKERIEAIAAESALLPEIKIFTVTALAGSNVSTTLTHDLGIADYLVQIVTPAGDNIVLPFTRTENTVVFHFGDVAADTDYTVVIVQ